MNTKYKFVVNNRFGKQEPFSDARFLFWSEDNKGYWQVWADGSTNWVKANSWAKTSLETGNWAEVGAATALGFMETPGSLNRVLENLRKIERGPGEVKVELNDEYTAIYRPNVDSKIVKVGCQDIPKKKVLELAEAIKKADENLLDSK